MLHDPALQRRQIRFFMWYRDQADTAISSFDSSPQVTRTGGLEGLRGFSAELSQWISTSRRVPLGNGTNCLKRYLSCQAKSQSLITSRVLSSPPGRLAVIFITLAR